MVRKKLQVSKLFRAYGLYNEGSIQLSGFGSLFQSSFELTGYITTEGEYISNITNMVSKLFRAYGLYNY